MFQGAFTPGFSLRHTRDPAPMGDVTVQIRLTTRTGV